MNIWGYQRKKKTITKLLKIENNKEHVNKCKIERLEQAHKNCSSMIIKLKKQKLKKDKK